MTSRRTIPYPDLESDIKRRMRPIEAKRDGWVMQAVQALWGVTGFLTGLGMALGYLFSLFFILPVVAVFRRVKR